MIYTITLNPAVDKTVQLDAPIAVGAVNRTSGALRRAGGKGINVARVAHRLGANVTAYTLLGGETGAFISGVLSRDGVPLRYVKTPLPTRTNLKCVSPDGCVTEFNERGAKLPEAQLTTFLSMLADDVAAERTPPTVLLCGSLPPGTAPNLYHFLTTFLHGMGCKVWVDSFGAALAEVLSAKPELIKPNRSEFSALLGREVTVASAPAEAEAFAKQHGIPVLLSLGADGVCYADAERVITLPAVPPDGTVKTTVGAGDCLLGAFVTYLARGLDISTALSEAEHVVAYDLVHGELADWYNPANPNPTYPADPLQVELHAEELLARYAAKKEALRAAEAAEIAAIRAGDLPKS